MVLAASAGRRSEEREENKHSLKENITMRPVLESSFPSRRMLVCIIQMLLLAILSASTLRADAISIIETFTCSANGIAGVPVANSCSVSNGDVSASSDAFWSLSGFGTTTIMASVGAEADEMQAPGTAGTEGGSSSATITLTALLYAPGVTPCLVNGPPCTTASGHY